MTNEIRQLIIKTIDKKGETEMTGLKRYMVKCLKCGYEWLAHDPNPSRCALCNNPNPSKPKVRYHKYESHQSEITKSEV